MGTHTSHGTDRISHRGTTSSLALHASASSRPLLTTLEQRLDSALVAARAPQPPMRPKQLSWNGVRVSDELQRYAACVARGEALAPYRGPVLARSEMVFPWNLEATPLRAQRRRVDPPWSIWQVAVLALLFAGVAIGGGASLLADADGAELPHWSTALLEPRLAEPQPSAGTSITSSISEALDALSHPLDGDSAASARRARTVPAAARAVTSTRSTARATTTRAPARVQPLTTPSSQSEEESALFVEAPSF